MLSHLMRINKLTFLSLVTLLALIWKLITIQIVLNKLDEIGNALESYKEELLLASTRLRESNETIIYAITPTYNRPVQNAELTRISQTLQLVPYVHWIVVEDSHKKSTTVKQLLDESNLITTHLYVKTVQSKIQDALNYLKGWKGHRGVEQRNMGLKWLRKNLRSGVVRGVVYFMDDDNSYDVRLFEDMLRIRRVGVWPVGLVGGWNVETPIVDLDTGRVTGFKTGWRPDRKFAIDMAGFAINSDVILSNPEAYFSQEMKEGMQETEFLSYFTAVEELEPLAENCTKVYVWHTRTEEPEVT